jgi:hypothetical protein
MEIRRIMVQGHPGQKCYRDSISTNKLVWWYMSVIPAIGRKTSKEDCGQRPAPSKK